MVKRFFLFFLTNILVILTISVVVQVLGVNQYLTATGLDYGMLLTFCLIYGFVGSGVSLLLSKFMAKTFMRVQIVDERGPHADLVRRVHQLSRAAGLAQMPEVGVYDSPEVNAFATGPSRNNSLVAVSSGLLSQMNADEVEGVLAHEVAHIANGDMVTMALIQGVVNAFVMFLARIASFALAQAMRGDRDSDRPVIPSYLVTFLFEMLFGFLALFIVSWFSRQREFRADAGSARVAGKSKMIAALRRLQQKQSSLADASSSVQAMKISSKKGIFAFLSTHPSLEDRIAALERSPL